MPIPLLGVRHCRGKSSPYAIIMHSVNAQSLPLRQRYLQEIQHSSSICRRPEPRGRLGCRAQSATATRGPVKESAAVSIQGSSRNRNEDRYVLQVCRDASLQREPASSYHAHIHIPCIDLCVHPTLSHDLILEYKCTPLAQVGGDERKVLYAGVFDGHGEQLCRHVDSF